MHVRLHGAAHVRLLAVGAFQCLAALSAFAIGINGSGAGSPSSSIAAWADAYKQQIGDPLVFNFKFTFAQDKDSSAAHGMPAEAIRLGAAALVLPPERIAAVLIDLANNRQSGVLG